MKGWATENVFTHKSGFWACETWEPLSILLSTPSVGVVLAVPLENKLMIDINSDGLDSK